MLIKAGFTLAGSVVNTVFCCTTCNRDLQKAIYDSSFYPNLFIMLSAFIVLGLIVFFLVRFSRSRHHKIVASNAAFSHLDPVPLTSASVVLGIGLGGFFDGIFFHQVLQWHGMLTNKVKVDNLVGKSVNMFWDGIFHLFCLAVVMVGVILMWKALFRTDTNRSGKLLAGGMIFGWGLFNIIEGMIDHHLLKLHNVREVAFNPNAWNIGFLLVSLVMVIAGLILLYVSDHYKDLRLYNPKK